MQLLPWGGYGAAVGAGLALLGYAGVALWRRRPGRVVTAAEASLHAARLQSQAEAAMALAHSLEAEQVRLEEEQEAKAAAAEARRQAKEKEMEERRAAEESRRSRAATAARLQQQTREEQERLQREQASLLTNEDGFLGDVPMEDVDLGTHSSPNVSLNGEEEGGQKGRQGGGIRYTRLLPPLSPSGTPNATT